MLDAGMLNTEAAFVAPAAAFPDLETLERAVRAEIAAFAYPSTPWTRPQPAADGRLPMDVLIVGGGQSGLITAIRLMREQIGEILVVDRSPAGREGPWITSARMRTLRTSKHLHGTEQGIRSASFRVWFDTTRGAGSFEAIHLIDRAVWMEYLVWLRRVFEVPMVNDTEVVSLTPVGDYWEAVLRGPEGESRVLARKVVLATGIDSMGGNNMPEFLAALGPDRAVHSFTPLPDDAFTGKRVAVIGVGASAFDNAGTALETGAASVIQFGRRPELIPGSLGPFAETTAFLKGFPSLGDEMRITLSRQAIGSSAPPPQHSVDRSLGHPRYTLQMGVSIDSAEVRDGAVVLRDGEREWEVDFVVAGTGFGTDMRGFTLLAPYVDDMLLWGDVHEFGDDRVDRIVAGHPYLGAGLAAQPKREDGLQALRNLHLYNPAGFVSFGLAAHGLNGLIWSVDHIADAIVADFSYTDFPYLLRGAAMHGEGA